MRNVESASVFSAMPALKNALRLLHPKRVGRAQAGPRPLREVVGLLKFLREAVVAGVVAVAEEVPHRRLDRGVGEELRRRPPPQADPHAHVVERGVLGQAEIA